MASTTEGNEIVVAASTASFGGSNEESGETNPRTQTVFIAPAATATGAAGTEAQRTLAVAEAIDNATPVPEDVPMEITVLSTPYTGPTSMDIEPTTSSVTAGGNPSTTVTPGTADAMLDRMLEEHSRKKATEASSTMHWRTKTRRVQDPQASEHTEAMSECDDAHP